MWDSYLSGANIANHRIELALADKMPIVFAPYRASANAQECKKNENNKVMSEEIIDKARMHGLHQQCSHKMGTIHYAIVSTIES